MRPPKPVRELLAQEQEVPYVKFQDKVSKARCPGCQMKGRLLTGPFYDRGRLRCMECGHKMRVKVK